MDRTDSDEEAAGGAIATRSDALPPRRQPASVRRAAREAITTPYGAVCHATRALRSYIARLTSLDAGEVGGVAEVVTFVVGGVPFAVHRSLLRKDPDSLLFLLAKERGTLDALSETKVALAHRSQRRPSPTLHHRASKRPREDTACALLPSHATIDIPDRDPAVFARLLRLLRGYRAAITPDWLAACRAEMVYYGLQSSWDAVYASRADYKFCTPPQGMRVRSDIVCYLASPAYEGGEHVIDFAVTQSDRVAVGVLSGSDADAHAWHDAEWQDAWSENDALQAMRGSALYWSDGKVTTHFDSLRVTDSGWPYPTPVVIQVVLDADEGLARWMLNEDCCVAMQRLPRGAPYAFFVVAARSSQVSIVNAQYA